MSPCSPLVPVLICPVAILAASQADFPREGICRLLLVTLCQWLSLPPLDSPRSPLGARWPLLLVGGCGRQGREELCPQRRRVSVTWGPCLVWHPGCVRASAQPAVLSLPLWASHILSHSSGLSSLATTAQVALWEALWELGEAQLVRVELRALMSVCGCNSTQPGHAEHLLANMCIIMTASPLPRPQFTSHSPVDAQGRSGSLDTDAELRASEKGPEHSWTSTHPAIPIVSSAPSSQETRRGQGTGPSVSRFQPRVGSRAADHFRARHPPSLPRAPEGLCVSVSPPARVSSTSSYTLPSPLSEKVSLFPFPGATVVEQQKGKHTRGSENMAFRKKVRFDVQVLKMLP